MYRIARMERSSPEMISLVERAIGTEADLTFSQGMRAVGWSGRGRSGAQPAQGHAREGSARHGRRSGTRRCATRSRTSCSSSRTSWRSTTGRCSACCAKSTQAAGAGAQGASEELKGKIMGSMSQRAVAGTQGRDGVPRRRCKYARRRSRAGDDRATGAVARRGRRDRPQRRSRRCVHRRRRRNRCICRRRNVGRSTSCRCPTSSRRLARIRTARTEQPDRRSSSAHFAARRTRLEEAAYEPARCGTLDGEAAEATRLAGMRARDETRRRRCSAKRSGSRRRGELAALAVRSSRRIFVEREVGHRTDDQSRIW